MSGLFITIDGLDGVGKSTLVEGLARALGGVAMATPGASLSEVRAEVLAGLGHAPLARAVFYLSTVIARGEEARASERVVVMDRYWLSTVAYACARGVGEELWALQGLVPPPDLALVLTLEEGERARRLTRRGRCTVADRATLAPAFRRKIWRGLTGDRARAFAPHRVVDLTGAQEAEAVDRAAEVVRAFRETLPPPGAKG